jgi:competence protein ComEC
VAKVVGLVKGERCFVENEKVFLYFNKNVDAGQVSRSSTIVINKKLIPIQNIQGTDFDYVRYCQLRHIYAQIYLSENDFAVVGHEEEKRLLSVLDDFRKKLLVILKKQIPDKSESGFLEALLFGYTDDLDPSLMKSYSDTGVIHIIAISGLHLALIFQLLQLSLFGFGRKSFTLWLKFIFILSILWAYSLFSGGSPSVIRAATMFSLALFARNIQHESFLYNSLSSSAFLLLCYDPGWLWDTGFQLSYAAVLGLGLFARRLEALIQVRNKALQGIWKACSVSIAAQLLTLPISIYYFHQFPVYFLFANLLAIPLSSAILVAGIVLCFIYPIGFFAKMLSWILILSVQALNSTIGFFSRLPGSVISPLTINLPQVFSLYFIILCIYWFLNMKKTGWLMAGLAGILIFQVFHYLR